MPLLASALLAAVGVTLLLMIPGLAHIGEPWNIVVVSQAIGFARLTFIVAAAHALVLGVPLFLLLRSKRHVGAGTCALGGFIVGATPLGTLALLSMFVWHNAWTDDTPTVINGVPTIAGWIEYAFSISSIGLLGLVGGLIFWSAMRLAGQLAYEPSATWLQPGKLRRGAWSVVSVAAAFTCAVFLLPSILRDRSCYNLFRDGRTSVGPQILADIDLPAEDWPRLRQMFVGFGESHSLLFREDEQIRRGTTTWRDLNLCSEAGVNIDALDQPWLAQLKPPPFPFPARGPRYRGIQFRVYELRSGSDWKPIARDLINEIDTTWPQKTRFSGPDGRTISIDEALKGRQ